MSDMASRVELTCLMDFYGPLLTGHRLEIMRLYCEEDLSLSEIAQQTGISRQAVADAVQKSRKKLMEYEEALGMLRRYRDINVRHSEISTSNQKYFQTFFPIIHILFKSIFLQKSKISFIIF